MQIFHNLTRNMFFICLRLLEILLSEKSYILSCCNNNKKKINFLSALYKYLNFFKNSSDIYMLLCTSNITSNMFLNIFKCYILLIHKIDNDILGVQSVTVLNSVYHSFL